MTELELDQLVLRYWGQCIAFHLYDFLHHQEPPAKTPLNSLFPGMA
jgi:hypothetical protein